jgi:flavin-dependent dehydrogenase
MKHGTVAGPLKGAPLRTGMEGGLFSRPGLFVVGEGAGLTYSFSGEGIGKAVQSGIIAARIALRHERSDEALRTAAREYAQTLVAEFAGRFRAYRRMQQWLAYPAFANFLTRRANAGTFVRTQLQSLFEDTGNPNDLLSVSGLIRSVFT